MLVWETKLGLEPSVPIPDLLGNKAQGGEERGQAFLSQRKEEPGSPGGFTHGKGVEHEYARQTNFKSMI